MMTTVLLLLQTTNCSTFLGRRCILCTVMSLPLVPPSDLNVFEHSVLLTFHTFIEPSELALKKSTDQEFTYICQFLIHVLHIHFISVLSSSKMQLDIVVSPPASAHRQNTSGDKNFYLVKKNQVLASGDLDFWPMTLTFTHIMEVTHVHFHANFGANRPNTSGNKKNYLVKISRFGIR